ncbi:MAG TPA: XRE family transcriptional regulator [Gemmatimonadaceae bacterium]|nr:XRE family transcriptional regulator [Gemmatimonadaceae bacterium]
MSPCGFSVGDSPRGHGPRASELSQQALAERLGTTQPEVSRIASRTDMYLSTLRRFVVAMGGQLVIVAEFPDGSVRISQFAELDGAL